MGSGLFSTGSWKGCFEGLTRKAHGKLPAMLIEVALKSKGLREPVCAQCRIPGFGGCNRIITCFQLKLCIISDGSELLSYTSPALTTRIVVW